ncbi:unnamed protein product [Rotaria sp. Silwood2]|nr:unnamed protein product [Rotaria sp. Silwood2]CAF3217902.1 unnamed protein product [Rotaria sp. Silwood2]CAF4598688.1 unnamed protein product [Rotaria sp. Silwood2]
MFFYVHVKKSHQQIVYVNHFDLAYPRLGVDEQKIIGDLISNQFSLATITYNQQLTSSKFIKEWTDLENIIEKRDDY